MSSDWPWRLSGVTSRLQIDGRLSVAAEGVGIPAEDRADVLRQGARESGETVFGDHRRVRFGFSLGDDVIGYWGDDVIVGF